MIDNNNNNMIDNNNMNNDFNNNNPNDNFDMNRNDINNINNINNDNNDNDNDNDNDINNNEDDNGNNNENNNNLDNNNLDNNNLDNNKYNNKFNNILNPYNNLRPLLGPNGKPVKDADNNYVLLDEYNRPVKNTGITLLLDQTGKPVLNSKSKPILIDIEGKPINLEDDNNNGIIPNINALLNPDISYPNQQEQMQINNKKPKKKIPQNQQPFYQKINSFPNKKNKKPKYLDEKKKIIPKNFNNYNILERNNIRDKRDKGRLNYSECSPDSLRKINFMGNNEYKGACFACDVGCSISSSGYSPMNYSPYNNQIRRRDITPLKNSEKTYYEGHYNTQRNKKGIYNDNNYYLTEN